MSLTTPRVGFSQLCSFEGAGPVLRTNHLQLRIMASPNKYVLIFCWWYLPFPRGGGDLHEQWRKDDGPRFRSSCAVQAVGLCAPLSLQAPNNFRVQGYPAGAESGLKKMEFLV